MTAALRISSSVFFHTPPLIMIRILPTWQKFWKVSALVHVLDIENELLRMYPEATTSRSSQATTASNGRAARLPSTSAAAYHKN